MEIDVAELARQWVSEREDTDSSSQNKQDPSVETPGDRVLHLPFESSAMAWAFVEQVLMLTTSTKILGELGAETVEALIAEDHSHAIERLTTLIKKYPIVRQMLHGVWQNETPDDVWVQVVALRGN